MYIIRCISTLDEFSSVIFFPFCLTSEITHAVIVGIHKTARINLIKNRVLPPSWIRDLSRGQDDRQQQTQKDDAVLRFVHLYDYVARFQTLQFICEVDDTRKKSQRTLYQIEPARKISRARDNHRIISEVVLSGIRW